MEFSLSKTKLRQALKESLGLNDWGVVSILIPEENHKAYDIMAEIVILISMKSTWLFKVEEIHSLSMPEMEIKVIIQSF